MEGGPRAQAITSKIFSDVGVKTTWRQDESSCSGRSGEVIVIGLLRAKPDDHPDAMAYALPYDGSRIQVLYDRVKKRVEPSRVPSLLGHVLAHEITHLLQGLSRHSASGIMKEQWDRRDYDRIHRSRTRGGTTWNLIASHF